MCGISLIIDSDGSLAAKGVLEPGLMQMQKFQSYRGPDSGGVVQLPWQKGSLMMGSRRLQILDPTQAADQPMQRSYGSSFFRRLEVLMKVEDAHRERE